MTRISDLPRPAKRDLGRELLHNLQAREAAGPPEPGLDAFIPEVAAMVGRLEDHVGGGELADAARRAALARLELADCDVDTLYRHHEGYLRTEAQRRVGPYTLAAQATYEAAFPHGLAAVDEYIPDENRACRTSLAVLRSPEHAPTVAAIGLPAAWLDQWEAALEESDDALRAVEQSRLARTQHVGHGQDAEADFTDLMIRLRRYVDSRAARNDKMRIAEGKQLLAPLLNALKKLGVERQARATRRNNAAEPSAPAAPVSQPSPS